MRFFLFFLSTFAVLAAASRYLVRRSSSAFALGAVAQRAGYAVTMGALALIVVARLVERRVPAHILQPIALAGFVVALGAAMAAVVLAVLDLVVLGVRLPLRHRREPLPAAVPVPRRDFLAQAAAGSALFVGGGAAAWGTLRGRHDYALEELSVKIPGLSRALDGFTIAQLSDVHLGLFVREGETAVAEELIRRARPDLIVLTGDLIDHDPGEAPALGRLITRLAALARGGVVAIPGNHDYYAGIDVVTGTLARAGARVLRNQGMLVGGAGGFALLGLDDVLGPRSDSRARGADLGAAMASLPAAADLPRVLLCHNPTTFPAIAGKVALQLSGHTHGGQINLGVVRPAYVAFPHGYVAGRYERAGSTIYVNRGFGTAGPPARVGAPPEVTRVVLVSA